MICQSVGVGEGGRRWEISLGNIAPREDCWVWWHLDNTISLPEVMF